MGILSGRRQILKVSTSTLQLWAIAILIQIFVVSFFLESLAGYYFPVLQRPNATLYTRAVFWMLMLAFILVGTLTSKRVPKIAYFTCLVIFLYSVFGALVGVFRGAAIAGLLSHLSHNIGAMLIILSTSMVSFPDLRKTQRFLELFSILTLVVSGIVIVGVLAQISSAIHVSLTINALAVPFVAALTNRRPIMFGASALLIVLTIKRGLWLAALATFAAVTIANPRRAAIVFLGLGVLSFAVFILLPDDSIISQLITVKFSESESASLDALSSGRLRILSSLHFALLSRDALLSGLGFGAFFDANSNLPGASMAWITNGLDVSFAHFWFLYGYVFGSLFFLFYSYIALISLLWARRSGDYILIFLSRTSLFLFFASLSTFIAWDPLHWVIIGLAFARRNQLSRIHRCPKVRSVSV